VVYATTGSVGKAERCGRIVAVDAPGPPSEDRDGATALAAPERKRLGAWSTPPELIDFLVRQVLEPAVASRRDLHGFRVLDPACGDGRILDAVLRHLAPRFGDAAARRTIHGIELHAPTADTARRSLGIGTAQLATGDARAMTTGFAAGFDPGGFDVVLGNPPFLNQLAAATSRSGRSVLGGGPYADVAAEFLALARRVARPDGGRIGLVLPASVLATRDAAPIRRQLLETSSLEGLWWVGEKVFDAAVRTIVVSVCRGRNSGPVRRWTGVPPAMASATAPPAADDPTWGPLVAELLGIPAVSLPADGPRVADVASALAGFRQHFYGLVPYVADRAADDGASDEDTTVPLVTTGLIDPGDCAWGQRPARFAGRVLARPAVDLAALDTGDPRVAAWVRARRVPKVVVASQTPVIEAAVDATGTWVPSVPLIALTPRRPAAASEAADAELWRLGAALCAPPLSAWAAARCLGAALSPGAIKLRPDELLDLPLPTGWTLSRRLTAAAERLRAGDVHGCAELAMAAYGVDDPGLLAWWRARTRPPRGRGGAAGGSVVKDRRSGARGQALWA
jgi:N-6 DNA Methylase